MNPFDFCFRDQRAGYFSGAEFPRAIGLHRYVPYRSPAHLELVRFLGRAPAQCSLADGLTVVWFHVTAIPEPGTLDIRGIARITEDESDAPQHAGLVHEIWVDAQGLEMCCPAGPAGDAARATLGGNGKLLHVFRAACHFEAMSRYHAFLGREPYTTTFSEDFVPYPLD